MTAGSPDTAEKENYHLILPFSQILQWNELDADFVGFYAWQKTLSWSSGMLGKKRVPGADYGSRVYETCFDASQDSIFRNKRAKGFPCLFQAHCHVKISKQQKSEKSHAKPHPHKLSHVMESLLNLFHRLINGNFCCWPFTVMVEKHWAQSMD